MRSFSDRDLVALEPGLTGFARALTQDADRANDLVQDTFARALEYGDTFDGKNLKAWLFKMLRNLYFTAWTKAKNVSFVDADVLNGNPAPADDLETRFDMQRAWQRARAGMSPEYLRAIELVGIRGCSYEEAAAIERVPVGTLKSRVNRGRDELRWFLEHG